MKHRLFIAVPLDSEIKNNILLWQKKHQSPLLRMIKPDSLHLTLIPPWYHENIDQIIKKLKTIDFGLLPFNINFFQIEIGPTQKNPRLVWLVGKCPSHLIQLKNNVEDGLTIKSEPRSLIAHITICRFKKTDYSRLSKAKLKTEINWKLKVNSFCLYQSILSSKGAEYKKLFTYTFTKEQI